MAVIAYLNSFPAPNGVEIVSGAPQHEIVRIDGSMPVDQCFEQLAGAHAWQCVGARDEVPAALRVDAAFLEKTPSLLVCSASGSGVDVFDIKACTDAGVVVVNQAGANAESVAEHAVAMMISLQKHISRADRMIRDGWTGPRSEFFGFDLLGRTVGIVGFGHIGRRVADICHSAFRCDILVYDPYVDEQTIAEGHGRKVEFDELLESADIVTVHTPLTDQTRQMFDADAFARMRPRSYFIITARGEIHDEHALADALSTGHIAGAGLDVWEVEPPPPDHPLVSHPNVISSPHVAGGTFDSLENMARYAATQILDILGGKPPARPINPDVLPAFMKRREQLLGNTD